MTCTVCGSPDVRKTEMRHYITRFGDVQYEILNVPCLLCADCKEVSFHDSVLNQIDILIANAKDIKDEGNGVTIEYTDRI